MSSTQTANAKPNGQAAGAVQLLLPFTDAHVMRGILDAMPARVSYFDKNRKFRYNNQEFYRFTGTNHWAQRGAGFGAPHFSGNSAAGASSQAR